MGKLPFPVCVYSGNVRALHDVLAADWVEFAIVDERSRQAWSRLLGFTVTLPTVRLPGPEARRLAREICTIQTLAALRTHP